MSTSNLEQHESETPNSGRVVRIKVGRKKLQIEKTYGVVNVDILQRFTAFKTNN